MSDPVAEPPALPQISPSSPVLLTGATGFIGRRIQRALLQAGMAVRIVIRPGSLHRQHADQRCELIECSLDDSEGLAGAVSGTRAVVYCAGSVRGRVLADFLPANVGGVKSILQAMTCHAQGTPFLLISSLAASRPGISHYALSKHLGEQAVHAHAPSSWTILRPPAVYGPGDTEIAPLLKWARRGLAIRTGPEDQRVSLLFADDLALAVVAWLNAWEHCTGMTCAIDDGHRGGYDWPAIVHAAGSSRYRAVRVPFALLAAVAWFNLAISRLAGYQPMLSPGKARELTQADWLCDNTAFARATGWQPQTGLPSGIRLSLEQQN